MALRQVDKLENVLKSIKKYCVDTFHTGEGIHVDFGSSYHDNKLPDNELLKQWILVIDGAYQVTDSLSSYRFDIVIIAREVDEYTQIMRLRDVIMGYTQDLDQTDGRTRVPLYDVSLIPVDPPTNPVTYEPWSLVTNMVLRVLTETGADRAEDGSMFKIIALELVWGV